MAGSSQAKKPGMLLHVPSNEARARKRATAAARTVPRMQRPRPPDFREVALGLSLHRRSIRLHYGVREPVLDRWASEVGLELVVKDPRDPTKLVAKGPAPREFEMALDGSRWQAMQGAMTLNGRAVRGEVWRKEARGEYD